MIWPFNGQFADNEEVEIFLSVDSRHGRGSNPELLGSDSRHREC